MMKALHVGLIAGMLSFWIAAPCQAQTKAILDAQVLETVKQFKLLDPRHEEFLRKAAGVLVFPQVSKGGIALASGYGEGVLEVDGSPADYYSIAIASVGLTAGVGMHSEIILFMTPDALEKFRNSKGWTLAADSGIAIISKGIATDYDGATLKKPVLVFVFGEKGLIADLSLRGSKINRISK